MASKKNQKPTTGNKRPTTRHNFAAMKAVKDARAKSPLPPEAQKRLIQQFNSWDGRPAANANELVEGLMGRSYSLGDTTYLDWEDSEFVRSSLADHPDFFQKIEDEVHPNDADKRPAFKNDQHSTVTQPNKTQDAQSNEAPDQSPTTTLNLDAGDGDSVKLYSGVLRGIYEDTELHVALNSLHDDFIDALGRVDVDPGRAENAWGRLSVALDGENVPCTINPNGERVILINPDDLLAFIRDKRVIDALGLTDGQRIKFKDELIKSLQDETSMEDEMMNKADDHKNGAPQEAVSTVIEESTGTDGSDDESLSDSIGSAFESVGSFFSGLRHKAHDSWVDWTADVRVPVEDDDQKDQSETGKINNTTTDSTSTAADVNAGSKTWRILHSRETVGDPEDENAIESKDSPMEDDAIEEREIHLPNPMNGVRAMKSVIGSFVDGVAGRPIKTRFVMDPSNKEEKPVPEWKTAGKWIVRCLAVIGGVALVRAVLDAFRPRR